jgi:hypothetical protein
MLDIQSSEIFVNEEGDWFNEGVAITREDIVRFFLENVREVQDGRYLIAWGESLCAVDVADTPFVVSRVDLVGDEGGGSGRILLKLRHLPEPVPLDPRTLVSAANHVLYCRIHDMRVRARFSRPAYYQLARWIDEDPETGGFCLKVGGERYPIRIEEP